YTAFFFCFITLISCGENRAIVPGIEGNQPASAPVFTPATLPSYAKPLLGGNNVVTSTTVPRLNPVHGLPGHRCEIAVGAQLPVETPTNPVALTPGLAGTNSAIQNISAIQTNVKTTTPGSGLNPAHGQAGHRCDIAVGAKLPEGGTEIVTPATATSPFITPPTQNTPIIQPGISTPVAAGMNPPHGQTGHRCDVEVGKPLDSAPKKN
ncbi:MAG: hypothetical protein ABIO76_10380, partial [Ginsengibacter sp.]